MYSLEGDDVSVEVDILENNDVSVEVYSWEEEGYLCRSGYLGRRMMFLYKWTAGKENDVSVEVDSREGG